MGWFAGLAGGAMLAFASIVAVGEAHAQQTGPQNPGQEIAQRRQRLIDYYRAALREYEINGRSFATQRDCVRLTEVLFELENIASEDPRSAYLIPEKTHNEFTAEAKRLHSELSRIYTSLTGEQCPPGETLPQQSGQGVQTALNVTPWRPQFQIGGGVSSTQNIQVGNGNFNTKLDATGPQFGGTLSLPVFTLARPATLQFHFFGFKGDDKQNISGNGGTFFQATGGNQPGLNNVVGQTKAELTQIGGEALFGTHHPMRDLGIIFSPLFGVGFERVTLDTETSVRIAALNFHATDLRMTETDTFYINAGFRIENLVTPVSRSGSAPIAFVSMFLEAMGRVNFSYTDATAIYDTARVGVFAETLNNHFSRDTVTFGGKIGAGLAYTAPNGVRVEAKGSVASVPVHELRFHAGQMATIEQRSLLNWTAGGSLTVPFDFKNTGAPWPFRGVNPLRDWREEQERRRRVPL